MTYLIIQMGEHMKLGRIKRPKTQYYHDLTYAFKRMHLSFQITRKRKYCRVYPFLLKRDRNHAPRRLKDLLQQ